MVCLLKQISCSYSTMETEYKLLLSQKVGGGGGGGRGQAYDGAANMQGKRTGVATQIL